MTHKQEATEGSCSKGPGKLGEKQDLMMSMDSRFQDSSVAKDLDPYIHLSMFNYF